ncbi:hypothetical protein ACOSP7_013176 [Xanthoceras sorbifolium]
MENEDMINSMWNSNGSSSEFIDDSSSIGKEKVVSKGVCVGGKKGSKKLDCCNFLMNISVMMERRELDANIVVLVMVLGQVLAQRT